MNRYKIGILFWGLLGLLLIGCGGRAGLPDLTVVGQEHSYTNPATVPSGWTRIVFDNQGELAHDLILFRLEQGKTMDDVMALLESEGAPPAWTIFVGGATAAGGDQEAFISHLTPGQYGMFSFGQAEDAPPDAAQGMVGTFTVTDEANGAREDDLPAAAASVDLLNYAFAIDGDIKAGDQLLRVSNKGTEMHEMVVFRLRDGATFEQFQEMLSAEGPPEGEPPADHVAGTFVSPGATTYTTLHFDAGNYVLICFLPSPEHDMAPHFAMGMVHQLTITP